MKAMVDYWYWLNGADKKYDVYYENGDLFLRGAVRKELPHPNAVQRCYQDGETLEIWLTNGVQFKIVPTPESEELVEEAL